MDMQTWKNVMEILLSYCQIKTNIVDEIMLRDLCVECKFVISFWATHELILNIYIMSRFFWSVNERTRFFNPLLTLHMPNVNCNGLYDLKDCKIEINPQQPHIPCGWTSRNTWKPCTKEWRHITMDLFWAPLGSTLKYLCYNCFKMWCI